MAFETHRKIFNFQNCFFFAAYFNQTEKDFNFIAVNWMEGASTFNYIAARLRVDEVRLKHSYRSGIWDQ